MRELVVGVDIGGTLTKVGIVDQEGEVLTHCDFPTKDYRELEAYQKALVDQIKGLEQDIEGEYKLVGLGIGAPNANYYRGTIEHAPNLDWKGIVPFVSELEKLIDLPIKMTNDANAAVIGEKIYGNAKDMNDFMVITLGTGLGSGIVSNGKLIYGHDAMAGELGHVVIEEGGRLTGLGRRGGLEAYVSSTGLKRTVFHLLCDSMEESPLRDVSYNDLHGEYITELAEKGDPIATAAYQMTGKILGKALANFVTFSHPEAIFLLGGLAKSGKWIFEPTQKQLEESLLPIYQGKVKLLPSGMMNKNAAILGAAALILEEQ
ncbi:MAG: ROK family protein [bacterium]|nr:ROK family protein [bacterium]